ncbi:MAG: hypothetical protein B0D92_02270 [Spirochaeta sp. LUC14_002_19_P3]|nr:MAG: hypothetical protein B0D92_02270 [Spirochaeta sp. LUC14_002_19_P3]
MTFGKQILNFFDKLEPPGCIPEDIETLMPYKSPEVQRVMRCFYQKFYSDTDKRVFLIGINPGRFGAGVTGLCFTDPIRLNTECGIAHSITGGRELSSDFVYRVIAAFGGTEAFYKRCYLTAMSPVGFTSRGRNINYYDVKGLPAQLEAWMAEAMDIQLAAGAEKRIAFSMGQGENFKYLKALNKRYRFFERVEALPHPRWVMQYRRKRLDEFIQVYIDALNF